MQEPSKINQELLEEIAILKQRIQELEKSEVERKLTQEALQESERHIKLALEGTDQGLWEWDILSRKVIYDENWPRIMNLPSEGRHVDMDQWLASMDTEGRAAFEINMTNYLAGRVSYYEIEHRLLTENKEWKWIWTRGIATERDPSGIPLRMIGTYRDITKQKQAEEAFKESEERYKNFIEKSFAGVYVVQDSRFVFLNEKAASYAGYKPDELVGKQADSIIHPEDLVIIKEKTKKMLHGEDSSPYEFRIVTKDGQIRWIMETVTSIQYDGRKAILGNSMDVTEHKLVDEALQAHQELEKSIFLSVPHGLFGVEQRRIFFANDAMEEVFGWKREELIGKSTRILFRNDAEWEEYGAMLYSRLKKMPVATFESSVLFVRKDGKEILCRNSVSRFGEELGETNKIVATFEDITDRRRAEEALQESELKYRSLIEASSDAIFCVDEKGEYKFTNQLFASTFGKTPDYFIGKTFWDVYPKEHADYRYKATTRVFQTGESESLEVEVPLPGETQYFYATANPIKDATGKVILNLTHATNITERKKAEHDLRVSEINLRMILDSVYDAIFIYTKEGKIIDVNRRMLEMYGVSREEVCSMSIEEDFSTPDNPLGELPGIWESVINGAEVLFEWKARRPHDSSSFNVEVFLRKINLNNDDFILAAVRDITECKQAEAEKAKLESQLQQLQKMESVGRLAGGVAHDFNNMLGLIIGYVEMAMDKVEAGHPLLNDLLEIKNAAERSANLTHQLLAFARKQTITPKVLDLNGTVEGMLKMLRRLIGEDIHLAWLPGVNLWPIKVDSSQIDQILANLCVNARDAIAGVGKLTIETGNITLDEDYCIDHEGCVPGEYVLLAMSDNGCGMDKEILCNLFEPFFTTKGVGKGTGLGLATIYGIVKQNNGFINVYSEPNQGTTFRIYLPRHIGKAEQARTEVRQESVMRGHETVLVVEDEPALLELSKLMLETQGYRVLAAGTTDEAMRLAKEHAGEIHLLMTDVVMPEMNGPDLAQRLLSLYPDLKCMFTSGYTADVITHHGVLDEGVYFIQKPFSRKDLAAKVRTVLDQK